MTFKFNTFFCRVFHYYLREAAFWAVVPVQFLVEGLGDGDGNEYVAYGSSGSQHSAHLRRRFPPNLKFITEPHVCSPSNLSSPAPPHSTRTIAYLPTYPTRYAHPAPAIRYSRRDHSFLVDELTNQPPPPPPPPPFQHLHCATTTSLTPAMAFMDSISAELKTRNFSESTLLVDN